MRSGHRALLSLLSNLANSKQIFVAFPSLAEVFEKLFRAILQKYLRVPIEFAKSLFDLLIGWIIGIDLSLLQTGVIPICVFPLKGPNRSRGRVSIT